MGLSTRIFLLDPNDDLYRLANRKFDQMLMDPASLRFPRFAGTRVRMAHLVVELRNRRPTRVAWGTFSILGFDAQGQLDANSFDRHQRSLVELTFAGLGAAPDDTAGVVDASSRFTARGGRWAPSRSLARRLEAAALGRVKCQSV